MASKAYPQRYARAVFELALEAGNLDGWLADLQKLTAVTGDESFSAVMSSPKVKPEDKLRLVTEHLGEGNPLALNLVRLLVSRNSIGIIGRIAEEYQKLLDDYHGLVKAHVITAVPLDDMDRDSLAGTLGGVVGKEVSISAAVDPEILGGIIARLGGKLLDGSTRTKLASLKTQLAGGEKRR